MDPVPEPSLCTSVQAAQAARLQALQGQNPNANVMNQMRAQLQLDPAHLGGPPKEPPFRPPSQGFSQGFGGGSLYESLGL